MKHTPEPWNANRRVREMGRYILESKINGPFGHFEGWSSDGVTTTDEDAANARRIVACVNFCEGMPTEVLESGVIAQIMAW